MNAAGPLIPCPWCKGVGHFIRICPFCKGSAHVPAAYLETFKAPQGDVMRIYLITRLDVVKYDEVNAFVVISPSKDWARKLAAVEHADEDPAVWYDANRSSAVEIGEAKEGQPPGILLRAFKHS